MDFKSIESKWQNAWADAKIFEVNEDSKKEKFYLLEMFPYPSGDGLHMGHALNYSIGDVLARYKIMNGFNVLHPMGYDALGLPAENAAIKVGQHPQEYTDNSIKNFTKQFKSIGLSYDWSRMVNTANPKYYKWDQWIFLKMLEKGLVYQKESSVNWCPECDTVLANEQVRDGKCWRHDDTEVKVKSLKQWFLKITDYADELYEDIAKLDGWPAQTKAMQKNWINKKYGYLQFYKVNDLDITLDTFTTHHHTSFAEIFLAIAPEHEIALKLVEGTKYENGAKEFIQKVINQKAGGKFNHDSAKEGYFTGRYAKDFCSGRDLPIYIADFALIDFGTGIVKASAHDQRDYDFAIAHNIDLVEVLFPNKVVEKSKKKDVCSYEIIHPGLDEKTMSNYSYSGKYNEKVIGKIETVFEDKTAKIKIEISNEIKDKFLEEGAAIRQLVYNYFYEDKFEKIIIDSGLKSTSKEMELMGFVKNKENYELTKGAEKVPFSYDGQGYMFRSEQFSGMGVPEANEKMGKWMIKNKYAKKTTTFGLRDWGISRQRYWGTPIPIVHCEKCGAVPVKESDLPVALPKDVKFGKGNPLTTNEAWIKTKCPNCGGSARRETDTMDTFVNSSWYFLRYADSKNDKEIFDKKKAKYWCPVDQYIGGAEHACMHLIYSRFYTKFLADLGLINFREPAKKLFHQGMLAGEGGIKMSKSKGNVVLPEVVSEKYGIDTARLFLLSLAAPDKPRDWSENGIQGSLKVIQRIFDYFQNLKAGKDSNKTLSKLNKMIKEVTIDIDTFAYNLAIIKIRQFFEYIENETISKDAGEKFLKILSPFCPHLTEELWEKIGNKPFISNAPWPKYDEKLIDESLEKIEGVVDTLRSDILKIKELAKLEKVSKVKIFVAPSWKWDALTIVKKACEGKPDFGIAIKSLMENDEMKKHGKEVQPFLKAVMGRFGELQDLEKFDEVKTIEEIKPQLEKEFGIIELIKAEESNEAKAKNAFPAKPALLVE